MCLYLWCDLPRRGQRHQPVTATLQYRGNDAPPRRDIRQGDTERARGAAAQPAGWHGSRSLVVPANITLLPRPSKCPELNPVENVWQFMRDNWLTPRIFNSYDDILDQCCFAWNRLTDQPRRIMPIGLHQWTHAL
ncbi:transposase (plasmid) [Polymorphobacter sp. PAMC 29334]|nr:transposase [Polymorphobacter sp. PAMC 29334]